MFIMIPTVILLLASKYTTESSSSWNYQQLTYSLINSKMHSAGRRPFCLPINHNKNTRILILAILAGDIEINPGPKTKQSSVYPCGLCQYPVTWSCKGVCSDGCDIWHHQSCIELCTQDYELLERSNVQWHCCKCESINVTSFIFHSYEINISNVYEPLSLLDGTLDSVKTGVFSPLKTSSPKPENISSTNNSKSRRNSSKTSEHHSDSNPYDIPKKQNLRIMTVNCRNV